MKPLVLSALCALIFFGSYGQASNVVFFTEGTEKFTLFINGEQQNAVPQAKVKATGIAMSEVLIKIIFETPGAPELTTPMIVEPGMEITAIITKNKKGKYVFRPAGVATIGESLPATETVTIRNTATTTSTSATSGITEHATTQIEVTTSGSANMSGELASPSSAYGTSGNVNINASENTASVKVNVSESEGHVDFNLSVNVKDPTVSESMTSTTTQHHTQSTVYTENTATNGNFNSANTNTPDIEDGCSTPMTAANFEKAKKAIEGKSFAEEKMTICKQIIKANCLSVKQVTVLMELFSYEESKLQVAKLAYPKTVDKTDYYLVNEAFTYSGSVDDLNKFLESQ